jgi:hypothetical protein
MRWKTADPHKCLNLIGAIVLVVGLLSAASIYLMARGESSGVLGYEDGGGSAAYPIMPDDSKQYIRGLQLYGGTANVLADELRRWFDGLWHGKSLAYTVAFITIVISAGLIYAANHLPPRPEPQASGECSRGKIE